LGEELKRNEIDGLNNKGFSRYRLRRSEKMVNNEELFGRKEV
jgi:hypothetical protein